METLDTYMQYLPLPSLKFLLLENSFFFRIWFYFWGSRWHPAELSMGTSTIGLQQPSVARCVGSMVAGVAISDG